ncbi:MAG: esterase-like activity of phytase family protein [Synechococcaceae cyanobacterium]
MPRSEVRSDPDVRQRRRPAHHPCRNTFLCLAVAAAFLAPAAAVATGVALPCPADAGWQVVRELELPRRGPDDQRIGGFSAAHLAPDSDRLWLLSDLPLGSITIWSGLKAALTGAARPELERTLVLRSGPEQPLPPVIDGEGMVRMAGQVWVASEGRRLRELPAQLLRFDAPSGRLLQALELPGDWQPGDGRGLGSNTGPESLALLPQGEGPPALLMGAEKALLQDPARQVRLLRWSWWQGQDPRFEAPQASPQGSLLLPEEDGWGLTELLVLDSGRVLALLRRFEAPLHWHIRLAVYPLPALPDDPPAVPLAEWDLIAAGLTPDNWEGLTPGPPLPDGRPSLLLVSDDNLSPLQASRVAQLAPVRGAGCAGGIQPSTSNSARQRRSWATAAGVSSVGNISRKSLSALGW